MTYLNWENKSNFNKMILAQVVESREHIEKPHGIMHYPKATDRGSPSLFPGLKGQNERAMEGTWRDSERRGENN